MIKSGIEILLDSNRGNHIPQHFAMEFDTGAWHVLSYDATTLIRGPNSDDNEDYWVTWDGVLQTAYYVDNDGYTWTLWQDGDLFAICDELMSDGEYEDFYGEPRDD